MYRWPGKSGQFYIYQIYELPHNFIALPGNYIFAKQTAPTKWIPLYIGQSINLSEGCEQHQAMPCIQEYLATHIHAHANVSGEANRCTEADDLISRWNPPCNGSVQNRVHRTTGRDT